jgi:hypothetical protein
MQDGHPEAAHRTGRVVFLDEGAKAVGRPADGHEITDLFEMGEGRPVVGAPMRRNLDEFPLGRLQQIGQVVRHQRAVIQEPLGDQPADHAGRGVVDRGAVSARLAARHPHMRFERAVKSSASRSSECPIGSS